MTVEFRENMRQKWIKASELLFWTLPNKVVEIPNAENNSGALRNESPCEQSSKTADIKINTNLNYNYICNPDYYNNGDESGSGYLNMISPKDLQVNYFLLLICTLIGYIPTDFNRKTGKAKPLKNWWRRGLARLWFALGAMYSLYTNVRLGQSLLWDEYFKADHVAFHIQIATFSAVGTFWSYRLFIYNPQIDIALFNQLYPTASEVRPGARIPRRSEYTIQEWCILVLPFSLFLYCTNIFAWMYIYDRHSTQFIFSVLPKTYQTDEIFRVFLVFECLILDYYLAVAFQSIFLQVSFFQNGSENFKKRMAFINTGSIPWEAIGALQYPFSISECNPMTHRKQTGSHDLHDLVVVIIKLTKSKDFIVNSTTLLKECMNCRKMQLNIKLFNDLNAHIIFACKIYWLSVAIDNYFFGITYFHRNKVASACLLGLGIYHTFLFSIMYDKAFSVPERMKDFKNEILVTSMQLRSWKIKKEIRKIIVSIPLVGVKVGSFHRLERESTPNYVDYITEKVSGLLITFGHT